MMKMRYNVNAGLYEYYDRLTGEGIFDIFTKVGSEVAKKAASEGGKKALEKAGTQALEAGMKRLGDGSWEICGRKTISKESTYLETPWRHCNEGINERPGKECRL